MQFSVFGYDLTLSELIALGCSLFLTVFYSVKTHGLKNIIKEVLEVIPRRTPNYQDTEEVSGQKFSNLKPIYRLNKATGELELTDDVIDITELVNSYKDIALDNILERFLPSDNQMSDLVVERDQLQDDVDMMRESFELAEQYRKKYNLDDMMPAQKVFEFVRKRSEEVNNQIREVETLRKVKEELKNEKEAKQKSEQTELPQGGESSAS